MKPKKPKPIKWTPQMDEACHQMMYRLSGDPRTLTGAEIALILKYGPLVIEALIKLIEAIKAGQSKP